MKFTIEKSIVLEGLEKAAKAISGSSTIPILQGILLKVTKDELAFTGSNGESSVLIRIPVEEDKIKVEQQGATIIQKKALEVVKKLNNGEVTFETDDNDYTKITSGSTEFTLAGNMASEYPSLPSVSNEKTQSFVLSGKDFQDFMRKTYFCTSTSEVRPILQAVMFDIGKDCIQFIATDSHRLGKVTFPIKSDQENQYPIPSQSVIQMLKIFDTSLDVEVFIISDNQAVFRNGNTVFYSRLLEGNYPDTSLLIPKDYRTKILINRKELEQGLEQMALLAEEKKNNAVCLEKDGMFITLTSTSTEKGKGKVNISYSDYEGEDLKISFSTKFALEAIKSFTSEEIVITFQGSMKPFVIKPNEETKEELHLILPVRTA